MITLTFETANLVEAPPARGEDGSPRFLGPGTRALVRVILYGPEGASKMIAVSGATGAVFYDGRPTGARAGGEVYTVAQPFLAGRRARVRLTQDDLPALSRVDKVVIGHDGQDRQGGGPEWFLKVVAVQVGSGPAYQFACNRWLAGEEVELADPSSVQPVAPSRKSGGIYGSSKFGHASFV
jgi:hypothetical protein